MIEDILNFALTITDYVLNFNIRLTLLLDFKKITTLLKKSLMNAFNTFTFFLRFVRFALFFSNLSRQISTSLLRFARFVVFFLNLSRLFASEIIKKQTKKTLRETLKFFIAEKDILLMQKIIVDDYLKTIIEIFLSEKSRKAFSSSSFLLFFAVIKLHVDVQKKIKRAFHAVVKFVFKKLKRNVNDCDCKKMNTMILWKLNSEECKIDELLLIFQKLK